MQALMERIKPDPFREGWVGWETEAKVPAFRRGQGGHVLRHETGRWMFLVSQNFTAAQVSNLVTVID